MLSVKVQQFPNREIRVRCAATPKGRKISVDGATDRQPNLTLVPNSKPEKTAQKTLLKSGYGATPKPTKFGIYAKRTLLRVGGVIDQIDDNPENGIFLTGTLPGSTNAAMQAIADWSGYIVHRLKAWIAKYVREKMDFYVWERQQRGALHLHYYLYCSDQHSRDYLLNQFRGWWIQILKVVSDKSGVDLFQKSRTYTHRSDLNAVQAYAQTVKKSVAAYLSKYCSKQSSKHSSKQSSKYFPSRWWGASRALLAKLREMTQTVESVFSTIAKAKAKHQDVLALVEAQSIKGYIYGDRVGLGLNHVFYFGKAEAEKCFMEIQSMMDWQKDSSTMLIGDAMSELRRMIEFMRGTKKSFDRFWQDLSEQSRKSTAKLLEFQSISCMDAYAIASEIEAITGYLLNASSLTPQTWHRVHNRSQVLGNFFKNRIAMETEFQATA